MPHPRLSGEEIARRGEELYQDALREKVETEQNIGKIIAIDVESGDYDIADDVLAAGRRLHAANPGVVTWTKRIGYDAVYSFGGALRRTAP
jgi:hypothetical protein